MWRLAILRLILGVALLFFSAPACIATRNYHRVFYEGVDRFRLVYFPGGVTAQEAKRQTGAYMVLPAGYRGRMKIGAVWRNEIVGFTKIKDQVIARYLSRHARPVFAIRDETVLDIFGSFRSFQAAGPTSYQFGREADSVARDKSRYTKRAILAKSGSAIHVLVMDGRDRACRARLKRNKLDSKFVFLDGGSSLNSSARNPCYLAFFKGSAATQ